ncbi:FecR domain-containing protein [Elusimicrobiota bacterium]
MKKLLVIVFLFMVAGFTAAERSAAQGLLKVKPLQKIEEDVKRKKEKEEEKEKTEEKEEEKKIDKEYLSEEDEAIAEAEDEEKKAGDFIYVEGDIKIRQKGEEDWVAVNDKTMIEDGVEIIVGSNSYTEFTIGDNKKIEVNEDTSFTVVKNDKKTTMDMLYGSLKAKVGKLEDEELLLQSPVAVAAVRGTEYAMVYEEDDKSEVEVYDGTVTVRNRPEEGEAAEITVEKDNWAKVQSHAKPKLAGKIEEQRALRWKHLKIKKEMFLNLREKQRTRMKMIRLQKMGKHVKEPSKKEKMEKALKRMQLKMADLDKKTKNDQKLLGEIKKDYMKARMKKSGLRKNFIDKKRKDKIKERLKELEKKRKERKPK